MPDPVDTSKLSLTQSMILDVLAARYRLGENSWSFPSKCAPALEALSNLGLIHYKTSPAPKYLMAWFTDTGRETYLMKDYPTATVAKKDVIRIRTDSGFEHKMRVVHVEQYMILLAEVED